MESRGLYIVRFNKCYYIRYRQYSSYYESLGTRVVASIPADPEEYQKWLQSEREKHAALEKKLEEHVYEIHEGVRPKYGLFDDYVALPGELPRLDGYNVEHTYITNLDQEILTMDYSVHWKLGNIPRGDRQWLRIITSSIYSQRPTMHPDRCSEEHMAAPAVLPVLDKKMRYKHSITNAQLRITAAHEFFRVRMAAGVVTEYCNEMMRFGLEWEPDALPFREIIFAIISLAACGEEVHFLSFPQRHCKPRSCPNLNCDTTHLPELPGYLDSEWVGSRGPLCEFGSSAHFPGLAPGAAPTETTYWFGDVVVHLTPAVDNGSVSTAVAWGWEQGRRHFQVIIISLFEVAFAEVEPRESTVGHCDNDNTMEPFVYVTDSHPLSHLTEKDCDSSHPRERPVRPPGQGGMYSDGRLFFLLNHQQLNKRVLEKDFLGIVGLVNFLDVAAARRTAAKVDHGDKCGLRRLPPELYGRILDYTDYDTWKACLSVSPEFRAQGLYKFRIDDRFRIVAGPFTRLDEDRKCPVLAFDFEDLQTGAIMPTIEKPRNHRTKELNWMPIIGKNGERQVLMLDLCVQFEPSEAAVSPDEESGKKKEEEEKTAGDEGEEQ